MFLKRYLTQIGQNRPLVKISSYFFSKLLKNQVAVITGGSQGIGKSIALRFAKEGAKVVIADINVKDGKKTVKQIKKLYGTDDVRFIRTDCGVEKDIKNCMDKTYKTFGSINVLVNNAARFIFGSVIGGKGEGSRTFTDRYITRGDWDEIYGVNVLGYVNATKYAVPYMKKNPLSNVIYRNDQGEGYSTINAGSRGSIINISSVSSFIAQPEFLPYNTVKGAQLQVTRCCALDLGRLNIRVNGILPGSVETPASYNHMRKINLGIEEGRIAFADGSLWNR